MSIEASAIIFVFQVPHSLYDCPIHQCHQLPQVVPSAYPSHSCSSHATRVLPQHPHHIRQDTALGCSCRDCRLQSLHHLHPWTASPYPNPLVSQTAHLQMYDVQAPFDDLVINVKPPKTSKGIFPFSLAKKFSKKSFLGSSKARKPRSSSVGSTPASSPRLQRFTLSPKVGRPRSRSQENHAHDVSLAQPAFMDPCLFSVPPLGSTYLHPTYQLETPFQPYPSSPFSFEPHLNLFVPRPPSYVAYPPNDVLPRHYDVIPRHLRGWSSDRECGGAFSSDDSTMGRGRLTLQQI